MLQWPLLFKNLFIIFILFFCDIYPPSYGISSGGFSMTLTMLMDLSFNTY